MTKAPPDSDAEPAHGLLVVDDEALARQNLSHLFRKEGYRVTTCADGAAALAALERERFDVVLSDVRMPGIDGMALLKACQEHYPNTKVIMLTGFASLDNAVAAVKAGAFHYLAKPFRLAEVRELVARALELGRLEQENSHLRKQLSLLQDQPQPLTQNPAMLRLLDTARRVAHSESTLLIGGESGTGKELLARFIHQNSQRHQGPFVAINCGALQEELLASELFGHEKGAFTGAQYQRSGLIEAAAKGTLFLDEIGETSPAMQVKLLRVLENREFYRVGGNQAMMADVRFVAATNRDLAEAVAERRFRHDLYFRLNVVEFHLPSLAERRDDIPLLAHYFLQRQGLRMGRQLEEISPEAMNILQGYDYPGNIRELANLMERALALAEGKRLEVWHLPKQLRSLQLWVLRPGEESLPSLEDQERRYILQVLEHTAGNRTQAAQILGIDRVSLWRKLKRYGLEAGD